MALTEAGIMPFTFLHPCHLGQGFASACVSISILNINELMIHPLLELGRYQFLLFLGGMFQPVHGNGSLNFVETG